MPIKLVCRCTSIGLRDAGAIASCGVGSVAASTAASPFVCAVSSAQAAAGTPKKQNPTPERAWGFPVACRSPALTAGDPLRDRLRNQLPFAMRSWMCCARLDDDGCELIIELLPPSSCASFWNAVTRPFWFMLFCFIRSNE